MLDQSFPAESKNNNAYRKKRRVNSGFEKYTLEDLTPAIKAIEATTRYRNCKKIKNSLLKDKFRFLAQEEEKHDYSSSRFMQKIPKKKYLFPKPPVPLPTHYPDEDTPLSTIENAMNAEQAAHEFTNRSPSNSQKDAMIRNTLSYFADMETATLKSLRLKKKAWIDLKRLMCTGRWSMQDLRKHKWR
jgi:rubrerythrin